MALLGSLVDERDLDAIAAAGSYSYAHGLGGAPNYVIVVENTTTNHTSCIKLAIKWDATNVTIYNHGTGVTATLHATAARIHSLVK